MFWDTAVVLKRRIELMLALPLASLDKMAIQREIDATSARAPMSVFERYLTVWVFLCIVVGIALGQWLPGPFQAIGGDGSRPGQPAGRRC